MIKEITTVEDIITYQLKQLKKALVDYEIFKKLLNDSIKEDDDDA